MKKLLLTLVISIIFFSSTKPIFAHILATDHNIGAVLHIDPNDEPIAGQQASFFFEFKDKQGKFSPQNCNCTFTILENNNQLYAQPVFRDNNNPSLTSASVFFTFPVKDVYKIKVTGTPTTPGTFQPFTLTYDVRVDQDSANQSPGAQNWFTSHIIHILVGAAILVFVIVAFIQRKKTK
jgi:hypothetical protein